MIASLQNVRVCVDGRMLGPGRTGVATYARSLAAAHQRLSQANFILGDDSVGGKRVDVRGRTLRWVRAALPWGVRVRESAEHLFYAKDVFRLAQVHFDIHRRLLSVRPPVKRGIMHWSYPVPLHMAGWLNVYTIHDAIPLTDPSLTPVDPRRHKRLLRAIVAAADGLVTVSNAAHDDITAALALPRGLITNCSQPVLSPVATADAPADLPTRGYLLAIGTVEPRKNIARLLEAYSASGTGLPLIIAGPAAANMSDLEVAIRSTAGAVRMPFVDADALPALIAGARALVMPSLAEGFGLPVAEAMALGTPVITSSRGALKETAGDAALLVDPENIDALAAAIREVASDDGLCARLTLAGRHNAKRFTAERFADRLGGLYERLVAASPRAGSA